MIISFLGDSIVNGVGDPNALGWVGRLCASARGKGAQFTAYNLGVRRNSSASILERWADEVRRRRLPGMRMHLVFAFGVVDMVAESDQPLIPLEQSLANARAILEPACAAYPTLFVGPPLMADPAFTARITELAKAYAGLCKELGIPFLDLLPALQEAELYLEDLIQGDGVHPGRAGYGLIYHLVEDWPAWQAWLDKCKT